jgi:hypothetical protein
VRERSELCSERAIASVIPAIPAPIMAMLSGGEDEEPIVAIALKFEGARMSMGDRKRKEITAIHGSEFSLINRVSLTPGTVFATHRPLL